RSLWAVPALVLAALLWAESRARSAAAWGLRVAAVVAGLYGVALTAASALGGTDPLAPLPALGARAHALPFHIIKSVADLDRGVAEAKASGRTVLVDFSADWCTSCKEMERYTFTDPAVQAALRSTVLLRADVTRNAADDFLAYRLAHPTRATLRATSPVPPAPAAAPTGPPAAEATPSAAASAASPAAKIPEVLPDLTLPGLDGTPHRLTDWKGHALL